MTPPKLRLLVVEDEIDLRGAMVGLLALAGFEVAGVGSGQEVDVWLESHDCDVAILDLGLPDEDGLELARRLRRRDRGLIVCTARDTRADRLQGLIQGADHYLVKPVDIDELVVVIESLARRLRAWSPARAVWQLDPKRWLLIAPNRRSVSLTRSEAVILSAMAERPGAAVARDTLIERLGHNPLVYDNRRMEVMVRRLRRKVEAALSARLPLSTVHALGYAFTASIDIV